MVRSSVAESTVRVRLSWNDATSFTLSAIMRVNSCRRVKRSNSSGSNSRSLEMDMRDEICDSACISTSRSWRRKRARFSEKSVSEDFSVDTWFSSFERVIDTSPAWLTRRSRMSARTRTSGIGVPATGTTSAGRRVRERRSGVPSGSVRGPATISALPVAASDRGTFAAAEVAGAAGT